MKNLQEKVSHLDPRLQVKTLELIKLCEKYGFVLEINHMSKDEAQFILNIMSWYWHQLEGNKSLQDEVHRIANILRRTVGIPEEH